jgi:Na+/proline symporter
LHSFPPWFVGIAFAAIRIGALVPAGIMSIAAANLYTRNIHREFINSRLSDRREAVILNVLLAAVLTPVFNALSARQPSDETVAADCQT